MTDAYLVVAALHANPKYSLRYLAVYLGWNTSEGNPCNRRVHTALVAASLSGLVRHRGDWKGWVVTAKGKEVVNKIKEI